MSRTGGRYVMKAPEHRKRRRKGLFAAFYCILRRLCTERRNGILAQGLKATAEAIRQAGEAIREGRLVAFPTETVYGLGADATDDKAVASIFEAKGRPRFNPLIVHVASFEEAEKHCVFNAEAEVLARRFWPGGLTLVLPRREDTTLSLLGSAGLHTMP